MQRRIPVARFVLKPRLLAHAHVRLCRSALRLELEWNRKRGEAGHCRHRSRLQLPSLRARDPRHERQVIVGAPLVPALAKPVADLAVIDRIGIVGRRHLIVVERHRRQHSATNAPEIRRVVVNAIRVLSLRRHHVELLGPSALRRGEHLRVQPELEDRPRACLARELGVGNLVRPAPQHARFIDPKHHIGLAEPAPVAQGTLHDDIRSGAYRLDRLLSELVAPQLAEVYQGPTFRP